MAKPAKLPGMPTATNNTVKLPGGLHRRVLKAMKVEGFTVWSEFCRVALTEKCHLIEDRLRARDPAEFSRLFNDTGTSKAAARPKK